MAFVTSHASGAYSIRVCHVEKHTTCADSVRFPEAEIVGIDIEPQKRYPFVFVQGDALEYPLGGFDFIWASPPCQAYSVASARFRLKGKRYPDLVAIIRERLRSTGSAWCVENVPGSPLNAPFMLCGLMFGLRLQRHRLFETNFPVLTPFHPPHDKGMAIRGEVFTVAGKGSGYRNGGKNNNGGRYFSGHKKDWEEAMGIDWMTCNELSQAVPPAYSEFIGKQLRWGVLHLKAAHS